jgi:hypothetical protein
VIDLRSINLQGLGNWDLRQFADQARKNSHWNALQELVPVGSLASLRLANGYSIERVGCITPRDVLVESSTIEFKNKYLSHNYFDWAIEDIKVGDLLISNSGTVYVDESLKGQNISNEFVLLRPFNRSDGIGLWAILNSTAGKNSLMEYFELTVKAERSPVAIAKDFVNKFQIPLIDISDSALRAVEVHLNQIEHKVNYKQNGNLSWTRTRQLALGDDWFKAICAKDQIILKGSRRLEELIDTVVTGKTVRDSEFTQSNTYLPYITPKYVLFGRRADLKQKLFNRSFSALAKPGDLVIATSSKKAYFFLNDIESILGAGVVAFRPKSSISAEKLLSVFSSASVQLELNYLLSRGIVGHLNKSELLKLAIPDDSELEDSDRRNAMMIRSIMDSILWN